MIIYNHFFISSILVCILFLFHYKINSNRILYQILTYLLFINFLSFNIYLVSTGTFDYKIHLPIHLCYLTELGILIAIIFKNTSYYPWLALNSLGGGITGLTNSNLLPESMIIEYIHLYLSHFNLLLFFIIIYKSKLKISTANYYKSIGFNALIFSAVYLINIFLSSNYWFTRHKPPGSNLTNLVPEWPYYLLCLITIGFISYYLTFNYLLKSKK
jgi:uncharacterized membrane protein YwaF